MILFKLVTYGANRNEALGTMAKALDNYVIRGVTNNISLLRDIITEKHFVDGNISTKYLQQIYPEGFKGKNLSPKENSNILAVVACIYVKDTIKHYLLKNANRLFTNNLASEFNMKIVKDKKTYDCKVEMKDGEFIVSKIYSLKNF